MMYTWTDGTYLAHHGIKGQKWGVRNGPPYPIDHKIMAKGTRLNSVVGIGRNHPATYLSTPKEAALFVAEARRNDGKWLYTFNPNDKWDSSVYKGPFSKYIALFRGATYVAECQYETVKDLTMPTKKERVDEFKELLNDKRYSKRVIRDIENEKKNLLRLNIPDKERKEYENFDSKSIKTEKDIMTAYKLFSHAMEAMHAHKSTREYANRMAQKWDAMVDDNNQGVYNRAHDPVIIFRANEALKTVDSKFISSSELIENYNKIKNELAKLGDDVML